MVKKFKYNDRELVFSYQNPTVKREISHREHREFNNAYKLALKDKDGYSYSSNWINEGSLYKTKKPQHRKKRKK